MGTKKISLYQAYAKETEVDYEVELRVILKQDVKDVKAEDKVITY